MKKTISLILCVLCLFYVANISFAAPMSDDIVESVNDADVVDNEYKTEDDESFDEIEPADDADMSEDVNTTDEELESDDMDTDESADEGEASDSEKLADSEMYENDDEDGIATLAYTAANALSGKNIALGKDVTATNAETGNGGSNVVDGNMETRYSTNSFPSNITIDLGDEYTLGYSRIFVMNGTDRSYKYKIFVSNDNTNFEEVVDRSTNTEQKRVFLDELDGKTARYVKLTVTGGSYNWLSISEFEIYPFDAEVNWATAGTVTEYSAQQDDSGNTNFAKNLIDGDLSTRWSAYKYPNYVVIDLGEPRVITKTEVVPIENRKYNYKIEASLDGLNYYNLVDQTSGTPSMEKELTPTKVRFVKFTVTYYTSDWISISELNLFGPLSSVAAPIKDTVITRSDKTVTMTAKSNAAYGGTVSLIAVVYDGDRMIEVKQKKIDFNGTNNSISGSLTLTSDLTGKTIEAFVWDNDETMVSCSETFTFYK